MKRFLALTLVMAVAVLASAPLAWAADVQAKVQSLDQAGRWLTLDTGIQLKIPANVKVDKQALQPGTTVNVNYDTLGSEHVVNAIEVLPATK
jgi:hypothetical protein